MSWNGSIPYKIPYTGVAGTANFVPGAAAHPPAPQDTNAQGTTQQPIVADEPVAASTSRSKGKKVATNATASPPQDPVPARFASAGAAAASGGIAIVPGGLGAGSPSSSEIAAVSGQGQMSGQQNGRNQESQTSQPNTNRLPFGIDGQGDEGMPSSPTTMTMSAQRRADRALPVVAQELVAARAENQRLRDCNQALRSSLTETPMLRQIINSLQNTNYQLHTQAQSLFTQMSTIQQQAQAFAQQRQVLQAQLSESIATLNELTSLVIHLQCVIRNMNPDIFVMFPEDIQSLLTDIHEEWKWQEYCKMMLEEEMGNKSQSSGSSTTQTQNSHQGQTESQASYSGSANVISNESANGSSTNSDTLASDNASAGSSNRNIASTAGPSTEPAVSWDDTYADYLDEDFLAQMFTGHTLNAPSNNVSSRPQQPLTPETPSSIGTPRTIYSSAASETVQHAQAGGHGFQTSEAAQDAESSETVEETVEETAEETVEDITALNTINAHNTATTPKQ
ncbi:hypothetical protein CSHISOI_05028 [Colletotrichum shisoi]|uniref:Uncharacterized protein n=1 Tax=Colletotrichum shisoi TaxID=2078593 RepID=A0A5Q4BTR0_9PEZI|nr:hypothetical protein CSHISOI_05028 [Colletotrichum shisoi]